MKIRYGFVSNSSSSSFLIIGTSDDATIDRLLKAKGLVREDVNENLSFGVYDGGDIEFLGSEEIYFAGESLSETEMDKMPLLVLKQKFSRKLKEKYNISIPIEKLHLMYGEVGSG